MLEIGDLRIYQEHGICRIEDICDMTYNDQTRTYYVLEPIENGGNLTLNIPVDNVQDILHKLIDKEKAEKVLNSFQSEGIDWVERPQQRIRQYEAILNSEDRIEIAKVANTLMRKKWEVEEDGRNFSANDRKLLSSIENILFKEISLALGTTVEDVSKEVTQVLKAS